MTFAATGHVFWALNATKMRLHWGSAPNPADGAYITAPDLQLVGGSSLSLPKTALCYQPSASNFSTLGLEL